MNKTRKMVTETAKRLNECGIAVVNPDLFGTGDSEGAFAQASWQQWCDDLRVVASWAASEGLQVRGLLGIRTGSLLAAQLARSGLHMTASALWQPVVHGRNFVNQFLRLRIVSSSVNKGTRETLDSLRQMLEAGANVDVAGYPLTKHVVGPLDAATLDELLGPEVGQLKVVEIKRTEATSSSREVPLGSTSATATTLPGEPYWASVETVCDERVIECTVEHFREAIKSA